MAIIVLGAVTAILLNYWILEGMLAEHSDPTRSWISDLGARSESTGWLFSAFDAVSGTRCARSPRCCGVASRHVRACSDGG